MDGPHTAGPQTGGMATPVVTGTGTMGAGMVRCCARASRCGRGAARPIRAALRTAGVDDRLAAAVPETMDAAADRLPDPAAVDLAAHVAGLSPGR